MPNLRQTSRILGVTALAASTALTGPLAARAQNASVIVAQADPQTQPDGADAPVDVLPPQSQPAPEEAAPQAPEPEAVAPPAAQEQAPPREPETAAPAEAETSPVPTAEQPEPQGADASPEAVEPRAEAAEPAPAQEPAQTPIATAPEDQAPDATPADQAPDAAPAPQTTTSEEPTPPAETAQPEETAPQRSEEAEPSAEQPSAETPEAAVPQSSGGETSPSEPASPSQPEELGAAPAGATSDQPESSGENSGGGSDTAGEQPAAASETQEPAPQTPQSGAAESATSPAAETAPATSDGRSAAPAPSPAEQPAADVQQGTPNAAQPQSVRPENGRQAPAAGAETARPARSEVVETPQPVSRQVQTEPVPEGGVAASDARVQQLAQPVEVPSITAQQGERIEAPAAGAPTGNTVTDNSVTTNNTTVTNNTTIVQPQLPPNTEVVKRVGNRDILSIVGAGVAGAVVGGVAGYFIRGNDDDRIAANAQDRYYERLPDQRTRQTVLRPGGVRVVTITNEYGDIIQRSKILPDGREVVLFYDPHSEDYDDPAYYADPGAGLPPLDVTIPRDQYIVDVDRPNEDLYYRTMVAPPVETVERIYSLDEVRRSERIRDKVRRIDLSTINFDFGSDSISQDEVPNLQALAEAIDRIVDENPDETFLIEGHTDAVGSDVANLALSDRRAESVASALTQYFDIPPENLITQGYGEQDLKVKTEKPNRENRRVTVRRITALVKPVTTARRN